MVTVLQCEPVWPSGKALGWSAEGPQLDTASVLPALLTVVCGHRLVNLALSLPTLMQESFWW